MGLFKRNKKSGATAEDLAAAEVAAVGTPSSKDFSHINSQERLDEALASGELVHIQLLPQAFGGMANAQNLVPVPAGFDQVKSTIDGTIVRFAQEGLINKFACDVKYDDDCRVPRRLEIRCTNSDPDKSGSFNPTIEVW